MNFRTTSILFGLLIGMLFVFGIVVQRNAPPDQGYLLPKLRQLDKEDKDLKITTVVLQQEEKTYTLVADEDDNWTLQPPDSKEVWRIEASRVRDIIDKVKQAQKNPEADPPQDPVTAGLDPAKIKVTLQAEGGKEWWLALGEKSADKVNWFVRSSDRGDKIFAVETTSLKPLDVKDINDLRVRNLLEVTPLNAEGLTITRYEKGAKKNEVKFAQADKGLWRFKEPADLDYVDFEGAAKEDDQPGLKKLLEELGNVRIDKVEDFVPLSGKSLADFGLADGKETLRVEVKRSEPNKGTVTETLLVGEKVPDPKVKDKFYYYVRLARDNYVVKVDAKQLDLAFQVLQDPRMLRSRDLAYFSLEDPDAIDITWPGKKADTVKLRKADDINVTWRMFAEGASYKANQSAIDGEKGLLETLQGKGKIRKFFDETAKEKGTDLDKTLGFDDPLAEYSVYVNALEVEKKSKKKDEDDKDKKDTNKKDKADGKKDGDVKEPTLKKDAKPNVKLIFGDKDEDNNWVYVKRITYIDGKENVHRVAVPIAATTKVNPSEGYLAFLSDELPSIEPANVKKLELVRGSEKFVLEKVKKPADKVKKADKKKLFGEEEEPEDEYSWVRKEPTDLEKLGVDEFNANQIVKELSGLTVVKWVQKVDPAKADDLKKFGLKDAGVTVTLHVTKEVEKDKAKDPKKDAKDKGKDEKAKEEVTETRVYKFGDEGKLDKAKGHYALVNGTDIVFLAKSDTVKFLKEVELRGREVVKFEPDRVREIKLSGWKHVYKNFKQTLKLTRKDARADWKAEGPEEFELDPVKADTLADTLAHLEAKKFVVIKGGPEKDHKLTGKEVPLTITITLAKKADTDDKGKKDDKNKKEELEDPITLYIGAMNEEKTGYYALVSTLPETVFLVPKEQFDVVEKGLKYFSEKGADAAE